MGAAIKVAPLPTEVPCVDGGKLEWVWGGFVSVLDGMGSPGKGCPYHRSRYRRRDQGHGGVRRHRPTSLRAVGLHPLVWVEIVGEEKKKCKKCNGKTKSG